MSLRSEVLFGAGQGGAARAELLAAAVRASLSLLDLAPERIAFPLLAAVYRAVLGGADFAVHLAGQTGVFKCELAALLQQHYGAELDARHLPASWASTGNSLESIAFAAKDALLTVDDFAPSGSAADVARLHREAERLLRRRATPPADSGCGQTAACGRREPPRGLILSTGEDVPRGQSLRARLSVIGVELRATSPPIPANGRATRRRRGAVRRVAGRFRPLACAAVRRRARPAGRRACRAAGRWPPATASTPGRPASWRTWRLGLRYLLDFAADERRHRRGPAAASCGRRGWVRSVEAGAAQSEHGRAADPVEQFLRLLSAAVASGRAHVAATDGGFPETPSAWGWRREDARNGPEWRPQGRRMGWVDGDALLLEPEASLRRRAGNGRRTGREPDRLGTDPTATAERARLAGQHGRQPPRTDHPPHPGRMPSECFALASRSPRNKTRPTRPRTTKTPRVMGGFVGGLWAGTPHKPAQQTRPQTAREMPFAGRVGRVAFR